MSHRHVNELRGSFWDDFTDYKPNMQQYQSTEGQNDPLTQGSISKYWHIEENGTLKKKSNSCFGKYTVPNTQKVTEEALGRQRH